MVNQLYNSWFRQVEQLWPTEHLPLLRNITWLLVGIYLSRSVQLQRIAAKIPSVAKLPSITRRLSRCLQHTPWSVRQWYAPTARTLLAEAAETTREIRLIIDATQVSAHYQLVLIALAYHQRALPLIWTWVPYTHGGITLAKQKQLLQALRAWLPPAVPVLLVGDVGFGSIALLRLLRRWGWQAVLRQKGYTRIWRHSQRRWQHFREWLTQPGQQGWERDSSLSQQAFPTNLAGYWQAGEKTPWLLASSLPTLPATLRAYRRRMWIEELFGDLKKHGFDLEHTHLRHVQRLSRLTLLVALLYLWVIFRGRLALQQGKHTLVDRHDRRDLSLFQIGLRLIDRWLANYETILVRLKPVLP